MLDFTYIDDCVDGIVGGIERLADGRVVNQTINLAYGQGNTLVRMAELIAEELGVEPRIDDRAVAAGRGDALRRRYPQGARAAGMTPRAARRGHPAGGRLVPGVARGASRGGPPVVRRARGQRPEVQARPAAARS